MPSQTLGSTTHNPFFNKNYNPWEWKNPIYNKNAKKPWVARPNILFRSKK